MTLFQKGKNIFYKATFLFNLAGEFSKFPASNEPVEFAIVERRKLFPLDRESRRETTANNFASFFLF